MRTGQREMRKCLHSGFAFMNMCFPTIRYFLGSGPYFLPVILPRRQGMQPIFCIFPSKNIQGVSELFHLVLFRAKKGSENCQNTKKQLQEQEAGICRG